MALFNFQQALSQARKRPRVKLPATWGKYKYF